MSPEIGERECREAPAASGQAACGGAFGSSLNPACVSRRQSRIGRCGAGYSRGRGKLTNPADPVPFRRSDHRPDGQRSNLGVQLPESRRVRVLVKYLGGQNEAVQATLGVGVDSAFEVDISSCYPTHRPTLPGGLRRDATRADRITIPSILLWSSRALNQSVHFMTTTRSSGSRDRRSEGRRGPPRRRGARGDLHIRPSARPTLRASSAPTPSTRTTEQPSQGPAGNAGRPSDRTRQPRRGRSALEPSLACQNSRRWTLSQQMPREPGDAGAPRPRAKTQFEPPSPAEPGAAPLPGYDLRRAPYTVDRLVARARSGLARGPMRARTRQRGARGVLRRGAGRVLRAAHGRTRGQRQVLGFARSVDGPETTV
jgi:hypothetical protein